MLKIRLRRTGLKKQPSYRIVVADSRSPRDGRFLEIVGHYNPRTEPPSFDLDIERIRYWLSQGAQPTDTVARLLDKEGLLTRKQKMAAPKAARADKAPAESEKEPS